LDNPLREKFCQEQKDKMLARFIEYIYALQVKISQNALVL